MRIHLANSHVCGLTKTKDCLAHPQSPPHLSLSECQRIVMLHCLCSVLPLQIAPNGCQGSCPFLPKVRNTQRQAAQSKLRNTHIETEAGLLFTTSKVNFTLLSTYTRHRKLDYQISFFPRNNMCICSELILSKHTYLALLYL